MSIRTTHLSYLNPKQVEWYPPKIRDGKFNRSIGIKARETKSAAVYAQEDPPTYDPVTYYYVILPGVQTTCVQYVKIEGQTAAYMQTNLDTSVCKLKSGTDEYTQNDLQSWRIVSGTANLMCINSDVETSGYWEATHFYLPVSPDDWVWKTVVKEGEVVPHLIPADGVINNYAATWNTIQNNGTFKTGTVGELNGLNFLLPVSNVEHDPIHIKQKFNTSLPDLDKTAAIQQLFDKSMQGWIIKVVAKHDTKLRMESTVNYEMQTLPTNKLMIAETPCDNAMHYSEHIKTFKDIFPHWLLTDEELDNLKGSKRRR